jgi:hypothetical protein
VYPWSMRLASELSETSRYFLSSFARSLSMRFSFVASARSVFVSALISRVMMSETSLAASFRSLSWAPDSSTSRDLRACL